MFKKMIELFDRYKGEPLFKYICIIVILVIGAVGVQIYDKLNVSEQFDQDIVVSEDVDGTETQQEEVPKEDSFLLRIWKNIRGHLLIFIILAIALGIVKYTEAARLKER